MIREFKNEDLNRIAEIWLSANLDAHDFIASAYWRSNYDRVKSMFLTAEMYVSEDEQGIRGFIGFDGSYIAGLFVEKSARLQGIGKQLLDFAKARKPILTLRVYQKNPRAVRFYEREGFFITEAGLDEETGEPDFEMTWRRSA